MCIKFDELNKSWKYEQYTFTYLLYHVFSLHAPSCIHTKAIPKTSQQELLKITPSYFELLCVCVQRCLRV